MHRMLGKQRGGGLIPHRLSGETSLKRWHLNWVWKKLKCVSLASWVNGCLGKRKSTAKVWESKVYLGNNEQFGLTGALCAGNGKDEQNLGPVAGNKTRKIGWEQTADCELLEVEKILYSLYPPRPRSTIDAMWMLLNWCEAPPSFFWITVVTSSWPPAFALAPLQSILYRATAVSFSKHKSDHVTLLLTSFLTAFSLAPSDPAALASLLFLRHTRHTPALGLLH